MLDAGGGTHSTVAEIPQRKGLVNRKTSHVNVVLDGTQIDAQHVSFVPSVSESTFGEQLEEFGLSSLEAQRNATARSGLLTFVSSTGCFAFA